MQPSSLGSELAYRAVSELVISLGEPAAITLGGPAAITLAGPVGDHLARAMTRGVDRLVDDWCILRQVPASRVPARWLALGQRAGAVRNQQMLDLYQPVLVVAFPGHLGTADMVSRAKVAGVPVWKPAAPDRSAAPRAAIASLRRR